MHNFYTMIPYTNYYDLFLKMLQENYFTVLGSDILYMIEGL